jgi:MYXO-CTERM domain-containing protein
MQRQRMHDGRVSKRQVRLLCSMGGPVAGSPDMGNSGASTGGCSTTPGSGQTGAAFLFLVAAVALVVFFRRRSS